MKITISEFKKNSLRHPCQDFDFSAFISVDLRQK